MMGEYAVYQILIVICTLLSAFFSATETALISANAIKLRSWEEKGSTGARRALKLIDAIEHALGMTLIGNNIVEITAASFITYIASRALMLGETGLIILSIVQAVVFLVFCEMIPKSIALSRPESFLVYFSLPAIFFLRILDPVIKASLVFSLRFKEILGFRMAYNPFIRSREEIGEFFKLGEKEGIIDSSHQFFIAGILAFHTRTAGQAMTPIADIVALEKKMPLSRAVRLIDRTRYSRLPVYDRRPDNIIGYIYYRDLLEKKNVGNIEQIMRPASYVPATKKIYELFREMVEKKYPLVFVVNEFGGVEGMLTPEDIAEEIVGEIETRDNPEEALIKNLGDNRYMLSGDLDIDYFQRRFNIFIEKKGFETLAGFVTAMLSRIPERGDKFVYYHAMFQVEEATKKAVKRVMLILSPKKTKN